MDFIYSMLFILLLAHQYIHSQQEALSFEAKPMINWFEREYQKNPEAFGTINTQEDIKSVITINEYFLVDYQPNSDLVHRIVCIKAVGNGICNNIMSSAEQVIKHMSEHKQTCNPRIAQALFPLLIDTTKKPLLHAHTSQKTPATINPTFEKFKNQFRWRFEKLQKKTPGDIEILQNHFNFIFGKNEKFIGLECKNSASQKKSGRYITNHPALRHHGRKTGHEDRVSITAARLVFGKTKKE